MMNNNINNTKVMLDSKNCNKPLVGVSNSMGINTCPRLCTASHNLCIEFQCHVYESEASNEVQIVHMHLNPV